MMTGSIVDKKLIPNDSIIKKEDIGNFGIPVEAFEELEIEHEILGERVLSNENLITKNEFEEDFDESDSGSALDMEISDDTSRSLESLMSGVRLQERSKFKSCVTPKNESGHCMPFQLCSVINIASNVDELLRNVCIIDDVFFGICCPEFPVETVRVDWGQFLKSDTDTFKDEKPTETVNECGNLPSTIKDGDSWPWMASLIARSSDKIFCGGALITNQYVLTAAHCTIRQQEKPVKTVWRKLFVKQLIKMMGKGTLLLMVAGRNEIHGANLKRPNCLRILITNSLPFDVVEAMRPVFRDLANPELLKVFTWRIPRNHILVRLVHPDSSTSSAQDLEVIEIKRHAGYNPRTMQNDIALLKLSKRVRLGDFRRLICLTDDDEDFVDKSPSLLRWKGTLGEIGDVESLPVISNEECQNRMRSVIPDSILCAEPRTVTMCNIVVPERYLRVGEGAFKTFNIAAFRIGETPVSPKPCEYLISSGRLHVPSWYSAHPVHQT
ncbi:chymotrypsin-like protease CTRL-1 [Trichonephila clavipes]|nr:chymotrypsin-like protease CTRL-1 [Trichonephila clavipes]